MTKKELEKAINQSDTWDSELLEMLSKMSNMEDEWKHADGETFESVVYEMSKKIGIKI